MAALSGSNRLYAILCLVVLQYVVVCCAAPQSQGAILAGNNGKFGNGAFTTVQEDPVAEHRCRLTKQEPHSDSSGSTISDSKEVFREGISGVKSTSISSQIRTQGPTAVETQNRTRNAFSFKGIGVNFVKSIIHWQTFGINLVIPITPNFPEYDSVLQYPRVNCYVGMYYPSTLSFTVSASVPSQVVAAAAQRIARYCGRNQSSEQGAQHSTLCGEVLVGGQSASSSVAASANSTTGCIPDTAATIRSTPSNNKLPVSDSVRRVGLRFSLRYDREYGCRALVGPTMAYLPGAKVLELAKPVLLTLPTLLAFALDTVTEAFAEGMTCASLAVSHVRALIVMLRKTIARALQTMLRASKVAAKDSFRRPSGTTSGRRGVARMVHSSRSSQSRARPRRTHKERWRRTSAWLHSKTLGFAMNLGYFATSYDRIMGSNVIFELQPFFPLHKHLAGRSESRQFTYAARETSAAAQLAAPAEGDTSGRGVVEERARKVIAP